MTSRIPVFVVGTRAQLIKVAPVVVACERHGLPVRLLMTGQHQETMQDLTVEFGISTPLTAALPAAERATVGSLIRWLPAAYRGIRARLREIGSGHAELDVIVHGDTLSTVLGAVAGWRSGARVVHLESGLTSGKLFDPFPEELSRRAVFRLADVAMCPNATAADYMRRHHRCEVIDTRGNTILDAVALVGAATVPRDSRPPYLVASLHRFQNIYDSSRLRELVALLEAIATTWPIHFVLHPATRKRLIKERLFDRLGSVSGIVLSPRLGYGEFLRLAAGAACVLTDGGSNQEELAALGVPTIVMRKATERPDGLGANVLMEGDAPGGLRPFLLAGKFKDLAVASAKLDAEGPSDRIVRFLSDAA
jgi:UDP-N-acetylglucosamine 2-epimerase (non-hydrolysing)